MRDVFRVPEHIWRTRDGRLVLSGHPDAAILAYAPGDEFTAGDARQRGIIDALAGKAARDKPPRPAVKPGLTITKSSKENSHG